MAIITGSVDAIAAPARIGRESRGKAEAVSLENSCQAVGNTVHWPGTVFMGNLFVDFLDEVWTESYR